MAERPILFSAPMVRAILDGRKTQTRRVVKPQPPSGHSWHGFTMSSTRAADEGKAVWARGDAPLLVDAHRVRCPYGQPGDRLWVKEPWKAHSTFYELPPRELPQSRVFYLAGPSAYSPDAARYRHARFMPRWANRITLEVTGVRVERLQDIIEADSAAEGVSRPTPITDDDPCTHRDAFGDLWESINGAGSWDANPWDWVVEFRRAEGSAHV